MAQWVVESTDVASGKDSEGDWREHGSYGRKHDAMRVARQLRKQSPPRVRVRTRIDYARGGMAG